MKSNSKALQRYLSESGALNGSQEAIADAKRAYRAAYKRQWKARQAAKKDLRITLTVGEYATVKAAAKARGVLVTPYARNVIIAYAEGRTVVNPEPLLAILQLVGIAINAALQSPGNARVLSLLEEAETLLLAYLKP